MLNYDNVIPVKAPGDQFLSSEANAINDFLTEQIGNFSGLVQGCYYPNNDPAEQAANGLLYDIFMAIAMIPPGWRIPTPQDWDDFGNNYPNMNVELDFPSNGYKYSNGSFLNDAFELLYLSDDYRTMQWIYPPAFYAGMDTYDSMPDVNNSAFYLRYVKDDDGSANTVQNFEYFGTTYRIKKLSDGKIWFLDNFSYAPTGIGMLRYMIFKNSTRKINFTPRPFNFPSAADSLEVAGFQTSRIISLSSSDILSLGSSPKVMNLPDRKKYIYNPVFVIVDWTYGTTPYNSVLLAVNNNLPNQQTIVDFRLNETKTATYICDALAGGANDVHTDQFTPLRIGTVNNQNPSGGDSTCRVKLIASAIEQP